MSGRFPDVRVAAVQAASIFLDLERSVEKACGLIETAGRNGAQIVVFPEAFLPGHPIWYRFLLARSAQSRELAYELFEQSVEIPSPTTDQLGEAARHAGCHVAIGINERVVGTLGTLYNSLLFLDPDGRILGCHRKLVPTNTERLVHMGGDGSTLRTYDTPAGPIGGLICGEHTPSFARSALLLQGERIHLAAWPPFIGYGSVLGTEQLDIRVRYYAFEGRIFVVSAAGLIDAPTLSRMGISGPVADQALRSRGGHSGVVGPLGNYIAGPAGDEETIVYADLDTAEIVRGKLSQDVTGNYNRFDIFSLKVRVAATRPPERISFVPGAPESTVDFPRDPYTVDRGRGHASSPELRTLVDERPVPVDADSSVNSSD